MEALFDPEAAPSTAAPRSAQDAVQDLLHRFPLRLFPFTETVNCRVASLGCVGILETSRTV